MSPPFRAGIVGCGYFAPNQIRAWARLPGVALAGLCDLDTAKAHRLAKVLGLDVPVFANAADMVEQAAPDFLDIITTPPSHSSLVALAAEHGLAAVVQKPMALDLATAVAMVRTMREAGVPLMVHENFRFQAPIAMVKEVVHSGRIGRPVYARIAFRTSHDIYRGQPYLAREERFILADLGVHLLDVARYLLGEVERVQCEVQGIRSGIAGEDMASVLLRHEGGAISAVECSYASPLPEDHFPQTLITVEGDRGSVVLEPGYRIAVRDAGGLHAIDATPPPLGWFEPAWHVVQHSVWQAQGHWLDCLRGGREPQTSGRDNLKTLALVDAAYEAASAHRAVRPMGMPAT